LRTRIVVVAGGRNGKVASRCDIAPILRAYIAIGTYDRIGKIATDRGLAKICGAGISIVAHDRIGKIAPDDRIANISSAHVSIKTRHCRGIAMRKAIAPNRAWVVDAHRDKRTKRTRLAFFGGVVPKIDGARRAIDIRTFDFGMNASRRMNTRIDRGRIVIITVDWNAEIATCRRETAVFRADVSIITHHRDGFACRGSRFGADNALVLVAFERRRGAERDGNTSPERLVPYLGRARIVININVA
jgi:hypothetical protein